MAGKDYSTPSCDAVASTPPGWCYVQGAADTAGCSQAIIRFSPQGEPPTATTVTVACPTRP